eukprot:929710-Prorocentrum_lima.AAC.1
MSWLALCKSLPSVRWNLRCLASAHGSNLVPVPDAEDCDPLCSCILKMQWRWQMHLVLMEMLCSI